MKKTIAIVGEYREDYQNHLKLNDSLEPVEEFIGKIIAIIHRNNDIEEKWVVAPLDMTFTEKEIYEKVRFQEQYFESRIRM